MGVRLGYLGGDVLYEHGVRLTEGDRYLGNARVQAPREGDKILAALNATGGILDVSNCVALSLDQAEAFAEALLEAVEVKRGPSDDVGTDPEAAA